MGKLVSPRWIVEKRLRTCQQCEQLRHCSASMNLFENSTGCPIGAHKSISDEIAARAWPEGVEAISGCCDRME